MFFKFFNLNEYNYEKNDCFSYHVGRNQWPGICNVAFKQQWDDDEQLLQY